MTAGPDPGPAGGLACRGLWAGPPGSPVVRDVGLDVPAGRRLALVGPSGAGKTTLLRAIAGLDPLLAGTVSLGGERIDGRPVHRRRVAVVFQEPRLLPHLDVRDNVALPLRAAGVGRDERRRRAHEGLDDVGLAALARRRVDRLSGGEQQRVALARALAARPHVLLLDEPLAALDPERRARLRRLVVELQEARGVTTLAITHDRAEAAELGHEVAVMLDGRVVQQAPPRELYERPAGAAVARFLGASLLTTPAGDTVAVRPERVRVRPRGDEERTDGEGVPAVAHPARVVRTAYLGEHVRVDLALEDGHHAVAHVPPGRAPEVGTDVDVTVADADAWPVGGAAAPEDVRPQAR